MAIPDEKKSFLQEVLGAEKVTEIEALLDEKATQAEGMEYKEDEVQPDQEAAAPAAPAASEPAYVTQADVAEAVGTLVGELTSRLDGLSEQVSKITLEFKEMKTALAEFQKEDEERIAKAAELTPAASLTALMRTYSAIGKEQTKVDGRTELAKSKPAENLDAGKPGPTPVPFLNQIIAAQGRG